MLQYEWTKVDGPLSQSAVIRGGQLYITPVTAADAGRYRCVAITTAGTAEAYSQIIVSGTSRRSLTTDGLFIRNSVVTLMVHVNECLQLMKVDGQF